METQKKEIKFTYGEIVGFEFSSVIQKLANSQTNNKAASHIRQVTKKLQEARDKISKEHRAEILEVYGKKDDNGLVIMNNDTDEFTPVEGKEEELQKLIADFMKREVVIDWRPFDSSTLADIKISAKELGLLKDLYNDDPTGPGLPFDMEQFRNSKNAPHMRN